MKKKGCANDNLQAKELHRKCHGNVTPTSGVISLVLLSESASKLEAQGQQQRINCRANCRIEKKQQKRSLQLVTQPAEPHALFVWFVF